MVSKQEWFVSERAENLAIVLFTRFGVHVDRAYPDSGFDLRVVVDYNTPHAGQFGVRLEGHIGPVVDNDRVRSQFVRAAKKAIHCADTPVAILVFDVANDRGLFGWLRAPVVKRDGSAELEWADSPLLKPATNQRITDALSEFRRWYKAKHLANNGRQLGS
jgi:hypothetical protein